MSLNNKALKIKILRALFMIKNFEMFRLFLFRIDTDAFK
jgi:hypothetical protein